MSPRSYRLGVAAAVLATFGCVASELGAEDPCSSEASSAREAAARVEPTLRGACGTCHGPGGAAAAAAFHLAPGDTELARAAARTSLEDVALLRYRGRSLLLAKAAGALNHGGGVVARGADLDGLARFVAAIEAETACLDRQLAEATRAAPRRSADAIHRRFSIDWGLRVPPPREQVDERDLPARLRALTRRDGFILWVQSLYDEAFQVRRYRDIEQAVELLDEATFPDREWYERTLEDGEARRRARHLTNLAIATEPLELIGHVLRARRPFTEILTADYTVANDFSAAAYGVAPPVESAAWTTFRPVRIPGRPHRGVLTSLVFLNSFPTNDSNRNRSRAHAFLETFLATDLHASRASADMESPIASSSGAGGRTSCEGCHRILDPVAEAFLDFDARGRHRPDVSPSLGVDPGLFGRRVTDGLAELAREAVVDDRFSLSVIRTLLAGMTGRPPRPFLGSDAPAGGRSTARGRAEPETARGRAEPETARETNLRAYREERAVIVGLARRFAEGGFDLREAAVDLALSPLVRGRLADERGLRRLPPEALERRLAVVLGVFWVVRGQGALAPGGVEHEAWGGLGPNALARPFSHAPSVTHAGVVERLAAEVAPLAIAEDARRPEGERILLAEPAPSGLDRLFERVIGVAPTEADRTDMAALFDAARDRVGEAGAWAAVLELLLTHPRFYFE